ncbi:MAG: hypothetical protein M1828_002970 [Chrysothrix sp. TS-e1954]|nr:MAG: hypothetical protein M1828_002970 [Chrysothrix sp. TS-e1954]
MNPQQVGPWTNCGIGMGRPKSTVNFHFSEASSDASNDPSSEDSDDSDSGFDLKPKPGPEPFPQSDYDRRYRQSVIGGYGVADGWCQAKIDAAKARWRTPSPDSRRNARPGDPVEGAGGWAHATLKVKHGGPVPPPGEENDSLSDSSSSTDARDLSSFVSSDGSGAKWDAMTQRGRRRGWDKSKMQRRRKRYRSPSQQPGPRSAPVPSKAKGHTGKAHLAKGIATTKQGVRHGRKDLKVASARAESNSADSGAQDSDADDTDSEPPRFFKSRGMQKKFPSKVIRVAAEPQGHNTARNGPSESSDHESNSDDATSAGSSTSATLPLAEPDESLESASDSKAGNENTSDSEDSESRNSEAASESDPIEDDDTMQSDGSDEESTDAEDVQLTITAKLRTEFQNRTRRGREALRRAHAIQEELSIVGQHGTQSGFQRRLSELGDLLHVFDEVAEVMEFDR